MADAEAAPGRDWPALSLVMPTIAWDATFACCFRAALLALRPGDQALIVFDGTPPPPPAWLRSSAVLLLSTGQRSGPAAARNLAARAATTELLLFVDADVEIHADVIARFRHHFGADPGLTAVFGSYDDCPAAPGVVSRFRNLLHHHTHGCHAGSATTFWAGCGAIRRAAFLACGGFAASAYPYPSIEDIDLGLRLSEAGASILLDPSIQATHHKRWTLRSMLITDIQRRAIPWSLLLLQRRHLPTTLNLSHSSRLSAACCLGGLVFLAASLFLPVLYPWGWLILAGCWIIFLLLNRSFHALLIRRTGWLHGILGIVLHATYLIYASLTFIMVACWQHLRLGWRR